MISKLKRTGILTILYNYLHPRNSIWLNLISKSAKMVKHSLPSVAIIGGGPGGLGAAIVLSQLPFLQVALFEKNPEPREAGAGISLSTNAWRVLDLLGASAGVKGGSKRNTYQR